MITKRMRIEISPLPVLKVLGLNPNGVTKTTNKCMKEVPLCTCLFL